MLLCSNFQRKKGVNCREGICIFEREVGEAMPRKESLKRLMGRQKKDKDAFLLTPKSIVPKQTCKKVITNYHNWFILYSFIAVRQHQSIGDN